MSSTISQLSCFSSINRKFHLQKRSINIVTTNLPSKLIVVMNFKGSGTEIPTSETKSTLSYTGASNPHVQGAAKSYSNSEEQIDEKLGMGEPVHEGSTQQKKGAKIHDFCFGIPYGGIVLSGGLVGFLFSRNLTTLSTGVLFGGALLALSTFSLKVWRQGKSSLPFILGQAVLSAALLGKHIQTYSLTKKVFPTGFYAIISAAMLCFYSYVLISGGNPPPKKKTVQTATS